MMFTNKKILLILSFTSKPDFWMIEEYRRLGYEVEILVNEHEPPQICSRNEVYGDRL